MPLNYNSKGEHQWQAQKIGQMAAQKNWYLIRLGPLQQPENQVGEKANQKNRIPEEFIGYEAMATINHIIKLTTATKLI